MTGNNNIVLQHNAGLLYWPIGFNEEEVSEVANYSNLLARETKYVRTTL